MVTPATIVFFRRIHICLVDRNSLSAQMLRMFAMFRQDGTPEQDFKYLHVFSRIDKCEKWTDVWRTLAKARETYQSDEPVPGALAGRPDGQVGKGRRA